MDMTVGCKLGYQQMAQGQVAQGWGPTSQGDRGQTFQADPERESTGVQANFLQKSGIRYCSIPSQSMD